MYPFHGIEVRQIKAKYHSLSVMNVATGNNLSSRVQASPNRFYGLDLVTGFRIYPRRVEWWPGVWADSKAVMRQTADLDTPVRSRFCPLSIGYGLMVIGSLISVPADNCRRFLTLSVAMGSGRCMDDNSGGQGGSWPPFKRQ